jgi:arginase
MDLALATGRGPASFVHHGTDTCAGVHIDETPITAIDLVEVRRRGHASALHDALAVVDQPQLDGFWIHLDVDVLDDHVMPAVDYHNADGLTFDELGAILKAAVATGRACGLDVTIFNPALDPDGSLAKRLVRMITDCLT